MWLLSSVVWPSQSWEKPRTPTWPPRGTWLLSTVAGPSSKRSFSVWTQDPPAGKASSFPLGPGGSSPPEGRPREAKCPPPQLSTCTFTPGAAKGHAELRGQRLLIFPRLPLGQFCPRGGWEKPSAPPPHTQPREQLLPASAGQNYRRGDQGKLQDPLGCHSSSFVRGGPSGEHTFLGWGGWQLSAHPRSPQLPTHVCSSCRKRSADDPVPCTSTSVKREKKSPGFGDFSSW